MRTIWKYVLELKQGPQAIEMPFNAYVIAVQAQGDVVTLWAIVDAEQRTEARVFHVVGTGWELPDGGVSHYGTVQLGAFVWHVFGQWA